MERNWLGRIMIYLRREGDESLQFKNEDMCGQVSKTRLIGKREERGKGEWRRKRYQWRGLRRGHQRRDKPTSAMLWKSTGQKISKIQRQSCEGTLLSKARISPGTESHLGRIIDFFPEGSFSRMVKMEAACRGLLHALILSA